jgi:hypothetical protein
VGAQVPVKNVSELVAAMKAKPGDFKYASSGVGSTQHIAGEAFDMAAGTKSQHIPYKGSSQAHLDIIGGSVQMMFDTTSSAMAQIKAGKFKPLAVTTPARSPQLPEVPTLAEAGVRGADMVGKAAFATGVDEHGRGARGAARMRLDGARVDPLRLEPRPHEVAPWIGSDQARGRDPHPEPPHGDPRVADDAAGRGLDRIDVKQPAAPDGHRQRHGPHEDVGDARSTDDAIDLARAGG